MKKMDIIQTPEHQALREKVAAEYGFSLYRKYNEKFVADIRGVEMSTQKRQRRKGQVPRIPSEDRAEYLGIHIADVIILGKGGWDVTHDGNSKSETGGSEKSPAPPHGTDAGTTKRPGKPSA